MRTQRIHWKASKATWLNASRQSTGKKERKNCKNAAKAGTVISATATRKQSKNQTGVFTVQSSCAVCTLLLWKPAAVAHHMQCASDQSNDFTARNLLHRIFPPIFRSRDTTATLTTKKTRLICRPVCPDVRMMIQI